MIRTQISLDEEAYREAKEEARREGISLAEFLRRAVRLALPRLQLLPLTLEHHATVVQRLERRRGHKLTYVDASSLVFLGALHIGGVWGTDRDLALEGARVAPVGR